MAAGTVVVTVLVNRQVEPLSVPTLPDALPDIAEDDGARRADSLQAPSPTSDAASSTDLGAEPEAVVPTSVDEPGVEDAGRAVTGSGSAQEAAPIPVPSGDAPDWEGLARSVVQLWSPGCEQTGSGIITGDGGVVLTNSHVLHEGGDGSGPICEVNVGFTRSYADPPAGWRPASVVADDPIRDLAVVRLADAPGDVHPALEFVLGNLSLGDEITILGYPAFGQSQETLTFTSGRFSGTTTDDGGFVFHKTDALLDAGVSGGAVFDSDGHLVGVATGGVEGVGGHLGLVIPASDVLQFLRRNGFDSPS
ncbi:S1 family peptidase [Candidatus Poriferisodalis sp.]|uniref:S1 family peptidase n=1 Tax=Candidatus Poriferisodalis sp. TaxID=3101277 RepID=UPI003B518E74